MNISKYLEMRNLVLIEPETDEFVQVTYLCDMDSHMSESEILNRLGGLRDVGNANDKVFMSLGLYPVSIYYERDGRVMRSRENSMTDFEAVEDNVYRPKQGAMSLLYRMKNLQKKHAGSISCLRFFCCKKKIKKILKKAAKITPDSAYWICTKYTGKEKYFWIITAFAFLIRNLTLLIMQNRMTGYRK